LFIVKVGDALVSLAEKRLQLTLIQVYVLINKLPDGSVAEVLTELNRCLLLVESLGVLWDIQEFTDGAPMLQSFISVSLSTPESSYIDCRIIGVCPPTRIFNQCLTRCLY